MFTVGVIVGTHGLRGDLRVQSRTDFPELRFVIGSRLFLAPSGMDHVRSIEGRELVVRSARQHHRVYIVSFEGYDAIEQVESWRGGVLQVRREQMPALPEGEYFIRDLIGCSVFTDAGEVLGVLKDVLTPGANDVYVVERPDHSTVLLPAIPECILSVDIIQKRMEVHIIPGLMD